MTKNREFSLFDKTQAKGSQVRLQAELPLLAVELIEITRQSTGENTEG